MFLLSASLYQSTGPDKKEYTGVLLQQRWTKTIRKVVSKTVYPLIYSEDKILTALSYKETAQRFSDQQPQHQ